MKTSIKGLKNNKVVWKKNLDGFFNYKNRELKDYEIRLIAKYGIDNNYDCFEDIPEDKIEIILKKRK